MNTENLFRSVIEGSPLNCAQIGDLLSRRVVEDGFLEYKSGLIAGKKLLASDVRECISAFANSSGGILLLGVDENTWAVDGFVAPAGLDARKWVTDTLVGVAPHLGQGLLVAEHACSNGPVVSITVARSESLVPLVDKGQVAYFLRIHDKTLKAPSYLVQDLFVGRKTRPVIEVTDIKLENLGRKTYGDGMTYHGDLTLTMENTSFSWAADVAVGMVCWSYGPMGGRPVPKHLLQYVDIDTSIQTRAGWKLVHIVGTGGRTDPFTIKPATIGHIELPLTYAADWPLYTWYGALYVVPMNSAPRWYALTIHKDATFGARQLDLMEQRESLAGDGGHLEFAYLQSARPPVGVEWLG